MIVDHWQLPGVIYTQYLGVVTGEELIESSLKKSGDERFDHIRYIFGDWSQVKHSEISAGEVQELIACLSAISRICPQAVSASIVRHNEQGTALTAWYRHLGEILPWKIDIYHDVGKAFAAYNLNFRSLGIGDPPVCED